MDANVATWTVEIHLGEHDGRTHAQARLVTGVEPALQATGDARLSERDPVDVPEIGYELAAARALQALAGQLMRTAEEDVDAVAGAEASPPSAEGVGGW